MPNIVSYCTFEERIKDLIYLFLDEWENGSGCFSDIKADVSNWVFTQLREKRYNRLVQVVSCEQLCNLLLRGESNEKNVILELQSYENLDLTIIRKRTVSRCK